MQLLHIMVLLHGYYKNNTWLHPHS